MRSRALYTLALKRGLDPELRKAACWRRYFLERAARDYFAALETVPCLGQSREHHKLLSTLYAELASYYGLNGPARDALLRGLRVLRQRASGNDHPAAGDFRLALATTPENELLYEDLSRHLERHGAAALALGLLHEVRAAPFARDLHRARLLLATGAPLAALELLADLAEQVTPGPFACLGLSDPPVAAPEAARVFYLQGQALRELDQPDEAADAYLRAAELLDSDTAADTSPERYVNLAAFTLYRDGQFTRAYELLRTRTAAERAGDCNYSALYALLTLREEPARADAARSELRALRADADAGLCSAYLSGEIRRALEAER